MQYRPKVDSEWAKIYGKFYKSIDQEFKVKLTIDGNTELKILEWIRDNVECDWSTLLNDEFFPSQATFSFSDLETAVLFRLTF